MKRILITGGTGSLGHQLVPVLLKRGLEVGVYSRDEFKQYEMAKQFPEVAFFVGEIRHLSRLREVLRQFRPDTIIHAAAMKRIEVCEANPYETVLTDLVGGKNVVEAATEYGINALAVSTDKCVKPVNVYGMCKAIQERLFVQAGFNCVRYGNVIGSRGSVIPLFQEQHRAGKPLTVTDLEMTRFLLLFSHAIELVFKALEAPPEGLVFVRKSPAATVGDLARLFSDRIQVVGERPGEKLHESLISEEEMLRTRESGDYFMVMRSPAGRARVEYTSANTERLQGASLKALVEQGLREVGLR